MMLIRSWVGGVLLVLATVSAQAQRLALTDTAPLGTAELMNRLAEDSFTEIRLKYNDLQKNFTPNYLTSGLDLDCRTGINPSDARTFSGLRIENKIEELKGKVLQPSTTQADSSATVATLTSISHFDCFARLIFVERMRVVAPSAKPITIEEAAKFQRSFVASADESSRDYSLEDEKGTVVASIRSVRKTTANGSQLFTSVHLGKKQWMTLDEQDVGGDDRRFTAKFFSGEYQVLGGRATFNLGAPEMEFCQRWTATKLLHEISGATVSQNTFEESIEGLTIQVTGTFLKAAFQNFIAKLPETVHVMVGVSDSPFLRELQLNYNRVILRKEEALVRQFFEKTIQNIKEGRLKVE